MSSTPTPAPAPAPAPSTPSRIKYASQDQVERLLFVAQSSIRDTAMLTVGYWRGLRASEFGKILLVDWKDATSRLYVSRAKGGVSAEYSVSPAERSAIRSWLKIRGNQPGPLFVSRRGLAISRKQVHAIVQDYARLAGWPPDLCHPHTLRHSIAVHLLEKGVDIYAVKDWLGHTTITSTEVYARITNPVRSRAEELAYQVDGGVPKVRALWGKDRRKKGKGKGAAGTAGTMPPSPAPDPGTPDGVCLSAPSVVIG